MKTQDWKSKEKAKVLLIGHDPRLQKSDTIADFVLFADYFFRPIPTNHSEKRKFGLAKSTFDYLTYLTNHKIRPEQVYITNLCNNSLPHSAKGKTVFIPESEAIKGIENIKSILRENPSIEIIFSMSLQVNYWLQKLEFYHSDNDFVVNSEPRTNGKNHEFPFYQPAKSKTFLTICGNQYKIYEGNQILIPILHTKNFPLQEKLKAYKICINRIRYYFEKQ
ncbi:MAG: hypothetical protein QM486_06855 [Flavobacteriaceae bacterium]